MYGPHGSGSAQMRPVDHGSRWPPPLTLKLKHSAELAFESRPLRLQPYDSSTVLTWPLRAAPCDCSHMI